MPFRHVVMFRFNDHVAEIGRRLDTMPQLIDTIRGYVHGRDVGVAEGNYDYVVVADFDNVDGWRTYRDHPDHQLLIAEVIADHLAERAAVQFST